jgi:adenylosuccinate synthase
VVTETHREREREFIRIGSTMKGTAAAIMDKIARDEANSPLFRDWCVTEQGVAWRSKAIDLLRGSFLSGEEEYMRAFDSHMIGLVEGAQGYSLGFHTRFWPNCTGRDVSPYQMLADCRVPTQRNRPIVWGTARTFPIRVANRFEEGKMVGYSGPGYPDQIELRWGQIGREPELTTVTRLPRRLFTFSRQQMRDACRVVNPDIVVLTFCDYVCDRPAPGTRIPKELHMLAHQINLEVGRDVVKFLAFGPRLGDIMHYDWHSGVATEVDRANFNNVVLHATAGG